MRWFSALTHFSEHLSIMRDGGFTKSFFARGYGVTGRVYMQVDGMLMLLSSISCAILPGCPLHSLGSSDVNPMIGVHPKPRSPLLLDVALPLVLPMETTAYTGRGFVLRFGMQLKGLPILPGN